MTNIGEHPNSIHFCADSTFSCHFGPLVEGVAVTPRSFLGNGHTPHIDARFKRGMRMEFTVEDATNFARQLYEAVAKVTVMPDCSGAVVDLEGTA